VVAPSGAPPSGRGDDGAGVEPQPVKAAIPAASQMGSTALGFTASLTLVLRRPLITRERDRDGSGASLHEMCFRSPARPAAGDARRTAYLPGAMSHEGTHEEGLPEPTKDLHRALVSLMEELEAVDWYQQRSDASGDDPLKAVMMHNRNEEVEHAMMTLEWIRRRDPKFDNAARTFLFSELPITEIEHAKKAAEAAGAAPPAAGAPAPGPSSLGIGSLRPPR
jgi:ferritin-like protein